MSTATDKNVTVTFDPNAINIQSDIIGPATLTKAGVMTALQASQLAQLVASGALTGIGGPKIFSNTTRPAMTDPLFAGALANGQVGQIWNSDTHQPNYTDGLHWYDAAGNLADL